MNKDKKSFGDRINIWVSTYNSKRVPICYFGMVLALHEVLANHLLFC